MIGVTFYWMCEPLSADLEVGDYFAWRKCGYSGVCRNSGAARVRALEGWLPVGCRTSLLRSLRKFDLDDVGVSSPIV